MYTIDDASHEYPYSLSPTVLPAAGIDADTLANGIDAST